MTLRRFHRLNALALALFIVLHLLNHAMALAGPANHIAMMEQLRGVYRAIPVETLIILLFGVQILIGVLLVSRRGKPRGKWAWAQVISGGLLAFFLLQHVGAVLFMRATSDLDTNLHWAASVVSTDPIRWYFIPYYWLGMTAIFVHIAAALHFRRIGNLVLQTGMAAFGAVFAGFVVAALSGALYDLTLPAEYLDYLKRMYGVVR